MRADLIALTPEAVAALSNMGLVKRAQREIAEGKGPSLVEEADGTVVGTVMDLGKEVVSRLIPKKSLKDCSCSCGAVGVCRHRVATALAYPEWVKGAASARPAEVASVTVAIPSTATNVTADVSPAPSAPLSETSAVGVATKDTSPADSTGSTQKTAKKSSSKKSAGTTENDSVVQNKAETDVVLSHGPATKNVSAAPPSGPGRRSDLLALTTEAVAALANMGLVKRAQKDLAEGKGPALQEEADGTVVGTLDELGKQITTRLPPGKSLKEASCSCGATGACRHRVAVALAYPAWVATQTPALVVEKKAEPEFQPWSPGGISDTILSNELGRKAMEDAKKARKRGIVVDVRCATRQEPHPTALLPSCTVKFFVPNDVAYARCDCVIAEKCSHVAIAVWAFRQIEGRDPSKTAWTVEVREATDHRACWPALERALALCRDLLLEGVVHSRESLSQGFAVAREGLEKQGWIWPTVLLEDLESQLGAYRRRSARYHAGEVASMLASIAARHRALVAWGAELEAQGALPPRHLLGEGEKLETRLDKIRLVSLGARVEADGEDRFAEVLLADPDTGTVLVIEKEFDTKDSPGTLAPALANRRIVASIGLSTLATGQVVTRMANRRANQEIRIGKGQGGTTAVMAQTGEWGDLPAPLRITSLKKLAEEWDDRPPSLLRPRLRAEHIHVLAVGEVGPLSYDAGEQKLVAFLTDPEGETFVVARSYRGVAPKALDHLAAVLGGACGKVRFISGELRRHAGHFELEVVALAADRVVVLDLEDGPVAPLSVPELRYPSQGALEMAIEEGTSILEEAAHQGLKSLPSTFGNRLDDAAGHLEEAGGKSAAIRLRGLQRALRNAASGGEGEWMAACSAWEDAWIRLSLFRELCG